MELPLKFYIELAPRIRFFTVVNFLGCAVCLPILYLSVVHRDAYILIIIIVIYQFFELAMCPYIYGCGDEDI